MSNAFPSYRLEAAAAPLCSGRRWPAARVLRHALLAALLGAGATAGVQASELTIASADFDFETDAAGGLPHGFDTAGPVQVSDARARTGGQAVRLNRSVVDQSVRMRREFGAAASGRAKFSVYVPVDAAAAYAALFADGYIAETDRVAELAFLPGGELRNRGPGGTQVVGHYQPGAWNDVELIWDGIANTQRYMLLVNGRLIGRLPVAQAGKLPARFELKYGANGASAAPADLFVDDISLRGPDESAGFDPSVWKITKPDGEEEDTQWLVDGNTLGNQFYYKNDGSLVFRSPNKAGHTDGSEFSRSELREMLLGTQVGDKTKGFTGNNWVLSTASPEVQAKVGGVDGNLKATLRVDHVSTTGERAKVGRVIIGQIHGEDAEPLRLYYRKLPENTKGSIFIAHEQRYGDDDREDLIGSQGSYASDPDDGIKLGEPFSYEVNAKGHQLTVTLKRPGKPDVSKTIEMDHAYDSDWMYFKAGVYNQNNSGTSEDYAQATFYSISATHGRP